MNVIMISALLLCFCTSCISKSIILFRRWCNILWWWWW